MFTAFIEMVVDTFTSHDASEDEVIVLAVVNPDSYQKLNRP